MGPLAILWPVFVLVALIYAVWLTLFFQRIRHLKNNPPKAADFATGSAALHYFEPVEMPANNLRHLFEMPVLFLALVPLLLITQMASDIQVGMTWIFVALRSSEGRRVGKEGAITVQSWSSTYPYKKK